MQKDEGQHQRDDNAQLVDRHDLGGVPDLERAVVAQPRGTGRKAREDQKQPAFTADPGNAALCVGEKHHAPRHDKDYHCTDGRCQIGGNPLDADFSQYGCERRKDSAQQCKDEPHEKPSAMSECSYAFLL